MQINLLEHRAKTSKLSDDICDNLMALRVTCAEGEQRTATRSNCLSF